MAFDLQGARALAHKLYCICQEPQSIYKPLSRSVRALRNKLEEADEALDETFVRPEDIRVLRAAFESKDVLNRLNLVLQRYRDRSRSVGRTEDDHVANLLAEIDAVARKLSDAFEGRGSRNMSLSLNATSYDSQRRSQWPLTTAMSSEDGSKISGASISWSFDSRRESMSERTSLQSDPIGPRPEEKQVVTAASVDANIRRQSPLGGTQRWQAPFAYFDPMSVDIDSASSHILRSESLRSKEESPVPAKRPGYTQPFPTSTPEAATRPLDAELSELSVMDIELPTRPEMIEVHATTSATTLPFRRTSRFQARTLLRSPQGKSRYRVVNPDDSNIARSDSCTGASWSDSPVTSAVMTSPEDARPKLSMVQRSSSLVEKRYQVASRHASAEEVRPDSKIVDHILQSWNKGLWDHAKTHLTTLLDRYVKKRSLRLTRRLNHLLGVIASLQGQWYRALGHFAAVFDTPIQHSNELDIGHCAAAHWMGDLYALLGRKDEAFFAYSLAGRSPQFQDSRWQPLQQCIQAELDACRGNSNAADMAIGWDHAEHGQEHESDASILELNIIDRDLARTMLETDVQSTRHEREDRCTLDQHRSRAVILGDLGFQFGSWQDLHGLQLDATAFMISEPWPVMFDPYFVIENVRRHRLLGMENDLLHSGISATKIPKKRSLAFSCLDLRWLVITVRKALTKFHMEWSEVLEHRPTFLVRVPAMDVGVATFHYFSISIYRLSFRPGYGVELLPDGISSARIRDREQQLLGKGIDREETKRIRKVLKDYLDTALKRHEAKESSVIPVMSINGVTSLHRR